MSGILARGILARGVLAGDVETLYPPLLTRGKTIYAPVVTRGAATISPPLLTRSKAIFAPSLGLGAIQISPPLVTRSKSIFSPSIYEGATLLPPLLVREKVVYPPTVSRQLVISPPLITRAKQVFEPVVRNGFLLQPPLVTRAKAMFPPTLIQGEPPIEIDCRFIARPAPRNWIVRRGQLMPVKIGPIQIREGKIAVFDFAGEGVTGALTSPAVTISTIRGADAAPDDLKVGDPVVVGNEVHQKIAYKVPNVRYLLQATATDAAGLPHTISAYLWARPAA